MQRPTKFTPLFTSALRRTFFVGPSALARGFTLIESMLSLGVFTIGFLGIVAYQIRTTSSAANARNLALATNIADSMAEYLSVIPSALATPLQAQTFTAYFDRNGTYLGVSNSQAAFFNVTTNIGVADSMGLRDTTTTIVWTNGNEKNPSRIALQGKTTALGTP